MLTSITSGSFPQGIPLGHFADPKEDIGPVLTCPFRIFLQRIRNILYYLPSQAPYPINIGVADYLEGAYLTGILNMGTDAGARIIIPDSYYT